MDFRITKQEIEKIESEDDLTLERILGIMENDLFQDVKAYKKEKGYKELPVVREEDVVKRLTSLTRKIGNVYDKNRLLFEDEKNALRKKIANEKLNDLTAQLDQLERDTEALERLLAQTDRQEAKLRLTLAKQKNLDEQLRQKQQLVEELQEKEAESEGLKRRIRELENEKIPQANKRLQNFREQVVTVTDKLRDLREEYDREDREYEKLCNARDEKQNDLQQLREKQQIEIDQILAAQRTLETEKKDAEAACERFRAENEQLKGDIIKLESEKRRLHTEGQAELQKRAQLEQEQIEEEKYTSKLKAENFRLKSALEQLLSENGRKNEENAELQEEIDKIRKRRNTAKDERDELKKEIDDYRNEISSLESQINECKEQVITINGQKERLQNDLLREKENYNVELKKLNQDRYRMEIEKSRTKLLLHEQRIQIQACKEEQRRIASVIEELLGDQVVSDNWMFSTDVQVQNSLREKMNTLNSEMKSEIAELNQLMKILEIGK